jgi:hypothetical protein
MDSPGHCAQYCSYTFMVNVSKKIVCIITMYKRATEKKEHLIGKGMFSEGSTILEGKMNKCSRGHHRCSYTDFLLNE